MLLKTISIFEIMNTIIAKMDKMKFFQNQINI